MNLDFSSLQKAVTSLEKAVLRSSQVPQDTELRDAVIQRFEYTYELSWKMLKRVLEQEVADAASIDALSFQDLFREAAERGIVPNLGSWLEYRTQRNISTHTYDENKAKSVYASSVKFLPDAKALLSALEHRHHG